MTQPVLIDVRGSARIQLERARLSASSSFYPPRGSIRCLGPLLFRSARARDVACLLDVCPDVLSWACLPMALPTGRQVWLPDFLIRTSNGDVLGDATTVTKAATRARMMASARCGYAYRGWPELDLQGPRLANARDLLRYASYQASLSDRVTVLAMLDDLGPSSIRECASAMRTSRDPVASIAALVLRRILSIELDDGPIGPDTIISRYPN